MAPASRGWVMLFRRFTPRPLTASTPLSRYLSSTTFLRVALLAVPASAKIKLRQYQEECIQAVIANLAQGKKRLGVSLATGSGKTVIFTHLIDQIIPHTETARQTLILAHRQELVEQAVRHCSHAYPTKTVDIEMGNMIASGAADITVASLQSIVSGDRIHKFNPNNFKLVLVDEAHHIVSPGYMRTLEYFGLAPTASPTSPALVGVSATFSRFDGLGLNAAIDEIVYHKDYIDMIGENWLSDVCFTTVQIKADISRVKKSAAGDFQPNELSRVINTDQINDTTVRTWLAKAKGRKSTLVFCVDLEHVSGLTNAFRAKGIEAQFVTSRTPKAERIARLDSFRRSEFPVLVNCGVFTEGTDIPNIDCVLLARPTKSRNLLVQMIGRGMRLHPGKTNCHIIDMVASIETGIVCTPTLFGLDPSELLDEADITVVDAIKQEKILEAQRKQGAGKASKPSSGSVWTAPQQITFTDYETVFDLLEDTSGEQHIRALSLHAWVCVGNSRYVLYNSTGTYLKISREAEDPLSKEFIVTETVAIRKPPGLKPKAPFMLPRLVARAPTFTGAVHAADTFAKKKYPAQFILKNQLWRNSPATEGQIIFLNKLRQQDDQLKTKDITKGKAGDMITKMKHGAKGRFSTLEADKKRLAKATMKLEQEEALKKREKVSVGPMVPHFR
ncbi:DEAD/DEAH box helicase-like protein [Calycina marina]|uniref:DEAD/DEAH box helicase-like protein n=1 Tax=Calycina marina TaxID=1763456 RepID=A0A9P7YWW5_9HELO|nr:DEAD/DEAH box helicase-like protein [Calycina marina]